MTAQAGDSFEYEGKVYCLLGYTGGELLTASDLGMSFRGGSTAHARGFSMVYGIDNNNLVVKHIVITGAEIEPITHNYKATYMEDFGLCYANLNIVIPLTGFVLFSDFWALSHLYSQHPYQLYEVAVEQGKVTEISEIGNDVRHRLEGRDSQEVPLLWQGNTNEEWLANLERAWEFTGTILPRKYDTVYIAIWYTNFKEHIKELRSKTSGK